jgi:hypothetical protein
VFIIFINKKKKIHSNPFYPRYPCSNQAVSCNRKARKGKSQGSQSFTFFGKSVFIIFNNKKSAPIRVIRVPIRPLAVTARHAKEKSQGSQSVVIFEKLVFVFSGQVAGIRNIQFQFR